MEIRDKVIANETNIVNIFKYIDSIEDFKKEVINSFKELSNKIEDSNNKIEDSNKKTALQFQQISTNLNLVKISISDKVDKKEYATELNNLKENIEKHRNKKGLGLFFNKAVNFFMNFFFILFAVLFS
jgi:hypothetical protein